MSVVVTDPYAALRAEIDRVAQRTDLTPDQQVAYLRGWREDLVDLLGVLDNYMGGIEKVREAASPAYEETVLGLRENANIRDQLLARGLATPEALDENGYLSHDDLDKLIEEGLLDDWIAEMREGLFDEFRHPRGRGGKFRDVLGRVVKAKGRHGRAVALPQHHEPRVPADKSSSGKAKVEKSADGKFRVRHADGSFHPTLFDSHAAAKRAADTGPGTPDHVPESEIIDVGDDVEKAAQLLGEGKHVRLNQPHQVSTLVDKLGEIVREAQKKGDKAPNFDLCKVSVKGTNLFCVGTKGVPRVQMPQFKGEPSPGSKADALPKDDKGRVDLSEEFRKHIKSLGVKITPKDVRADHLRASQRELNGVLVAHIADEMDKGKRDRSSLFISKDDYIVDGHHRWAATVASDLREGAPSDTMPTEQVDMSITDLLEEAKKFTDDWGVGAQTMQSGTDAALAPEPHVPGSVDPNVVPSGEKVAQDGAKATALGLDKWPTPGPAASRLLGDAKDTQEKHTRVLRSSGGARVYTPERKVLHDRIVNSLLRERMPVENGRGEVEMHPNPDGAELKPTGKTPTALFMAGGSASGKSSALGLEENKAVTPESAVHIDPDEIKSMIPEYVALVNEGDKYAAAAVHEESSDISKRLLSEAMARGLNVVRDGTGDSPGPKFANQVREMKQAGYEVHAFYVNAPTDVAVARSISRAQKTGRYVPIPEVRSQHKNVSARFAEHIQPLVEDGTISNLRMFDTSEVPTLFADGGGGTLNIHDQGLFDGFIAKAGE